MNNDSQDILAPIHFADELLLNEIDRICKKYKIEYFIWGGTMLGAVRHQDFIHWDDDVDVIFKRKEYNKFRKVVRRELKPEFEYVYPGEDGIFFDMIGKIIYRDSQLGKSTEETAFYKERFNKVSLDLFVLDDVAPGFLFRLQLIMAKAVYGMAMAYRYKLDYSKYSLTGKIAAGGLSTFGKLFGLKRLIRMYNFLSRSGSREAKEYFISNDTPPVIFQHYDKKWFETPVYLNIREKKYPVPVGYKAILSYIYGDYMKLPSEEKRKPKHIYDCNELKVYYKGEIII